MSPDPSPSLEALLLQGFGILPLATLSFLLSRSIRRDYLRYFWRAWTSLTVALFALYFSLRLPAGRAVLEPLYFLGKYVFAGFIFAGCRNLAMGARIGRRHLWLLLPAAAVAVTLARLPGAFTVRLVPHAAIMAALFALPSARCDGRRRPAGSDRSLPPVLASPSPSSRTTFRPVVAGVVGATRASRYTSPSTSSSRRPRLRHHHRRMERSTSPRGATENARRESLRGGRITPRLLRQRSPMPRRVGPETLGCVVVVDIDRLKSVNDTLGHAAGDTAIRMVARAIRQVVRADDPSSDGGDEFLVVLLGVAEDEARQRLKASTRF
jgi:hypothetical protein